MTTHDPKLLQQLERERADRLALRLTLQQLDAIAKDTRLPGEIAGTYGVTAAVILQIQKNARAKAARQPRVVGSNSQKKLRSQNDQSRRDAVEIIYGVGHHTHPL